VGHSSELPNDGLIYLCLAMSVNVDPQRRNTVQVSASFRVDKVVSIGSLNYQRVRLQPFFHLGKGVPDVLLVKFSPILHNSFLLPPAQKEFAGRTFL
jgi:hypothetical protein